MTYGKITFNNGNTIHYQADEFMVSYAFNDERADAYLIRNSKFKTMIRNLIKTYK